jgi:hypothetical protein
MYGGRGYFYLKPLHILQWLGVVPSQLQFIIKSACDTINTATNTMGTNILEIKGREVFNVVKISSNNPYKVDKDHKFYGKTYNNYQYNGIVFPVNNDMDFAQWKDSGKLYSVRFEEGSRDVEVDGVMTKAVTLQLLSCTNQDQERQMAETEAALNKIYKDVEATAVNESIMDAITA